MLRSSLLLSFSYTSTRNTVTLPQFKSIVLSNLYRQYALNKSKKHETPSSRQQIPPPPSQILIDVREPNELKAHGSVPFAVNVPLQELQDALLDAAEIGRERKRKNGSSDDVGESTSSQENQQDFDYESDPVDVIGAPGEKQIVFFCGHGVRSMYAMEMAESCGYRNCIHLGGGFSEYAQDPVTKQDVEQFIEEKEKNIK